MISDHGREVLASLKNLTNKLGIEPARGVHPADDVSAQLKVIHGKWSDNSIINGKKFTWAWLTTNYLPIANAILDAGYVLDCEFTSYTKGESSWDKVQGKIKAYEDAWENVREVMK